MAVDLLEMIKQGLPGNFSELASKMVGESGATTQSAVSAALPALLAAIAQKGASTDGAQSLMSLLDKPAVDTSALGNLSSMLTGDRGTSMMSAGSSLLTSLLGDKLGSLAGTLASVGGMRSSQSASNLLALLAPVVLGFIKRFIGEKGLGASGLATLLGSQGPYLKGALDSRMTNALGFASPAAFLNSLGGKASAAAGAAGAAIGSAGSAAAATAQRAGAYAGDVAADATRGAAGWMRWLPWVIGAIIVLFLLSRLTTCSEPAQRTATAPATPAPTTSAPAPSAAAPAASAVSSSTATSSAGLPTKVYFDVGQATLSDDAKKAIASAADTAKKDNAKVALTGYTDKTGDPAQNETLAKNRATAVKDALVSNGIAEANITMQPPAFVTGSANDAEARRVDITKAP